MSSSTAQAPGPVVHTPAPPPNAANVTDILGTGCKEGDFTCYQNQVSDNQIVTAYAALRQEPCLLSMSMLSAVICCDLYASSACNF